MSKLAYCDACNAVTESTDLVRIGEWHFCARCKGKEVQSLREQGRSLVRPLDSRLPRGPFGWLLVFAIPYAVIRPLFAFFLFFGPRGMPSFPARGFAGELSLPYAAFFVLTAAGLFAGILIWSGHRWGRFFALGFLYVSIAWAVIVHLIYVVPGQIESFVRGLPRLLFDVSVPVMWVAYFRYSKRVRNTFGKT